MDSVPFFPPQASSMAAQTDWLYALSLGIALFFSLLIAGLLLSLAVRYEYRREVDRSNAVEESLGLELLWTAVPLALVMLLFFLGAKLFFALRRSPAEALEIHVVGRQWMWKVQHPNGRREINELHVPIGWPVRLRMISQDVIHSFFVPAFRVKQDVLPGRYSELWFTATRGGSYHLFCAEYCGTSHARMVGRVVALDPAEYQRWLSGFGAAQQPPVSPQAAGAALFEKMGCAVCHRASDGRAPTLEGLYGRRVLLADGRSVLADEEYLRKSILTPGWKLVAGFAPIMPAYAGRLDEEEILQLIAYIRSLQRGARHG